MALPFSFSSELQWSLHLNARHGPFSNGSNLYAILLDKTNNHVEAWKSTDGGDSWAEQDSANHPALSDVTSTKICDAVQNGTSIDVAYANASETVAACSFSMSTDTWGSPVNAGPANYSSSTRVHVGARPVFIAVRSDGDIIVFHQGATESIMGTAYRRVAYSRREGGVLTSDTDVGGTGAQIHYDANAAILGSSDRVHFFWTDTTNSDLKHRTLTSANVLQTIQDITTSTWAGTYNVGLPVVNGSEVIVPARSGGSDAIVYRATSADTPTWSPQIFSNVSPEVTNSNPGALAVDGSTVYAFWPDDADQDIYRDNDAGTGTWGTDTEWKDAVTCQGISINKITNAIGVLYDDAGTVKYDVFSLGVVQDAPELRGKPYGLRGAKQMHQLLTF